MKIHVIAASLLLIIFGSVRSQDFTFGVMPLDELSMTRYLKDSTAGAVVLNEFGKSFIGNSDNYNLFFEYHVRIKILSKNGLKQSNIEIPLYKKDNHAFERALNIKASSFNLENGRIVETALERKDIFSEDRNKFWNIKKFAIPNVRVGSVIEIFYTIESPFKFNFRTWEFQSDIPKIQSEYWASIPGVYIYNIALRGFLKLSKNESSIVKKCLGTGDGIAGGFSADCALMKFGMKDIPAFVEEDYMTARKNFLSAINFELAEVRRPNGGVDKVTKEWKDAERELRQENKFGVQLKKGKDVGAALAKIIDEEKDELAKAKEVYEFIKGWYIWNGTYGMFSEYGIKKAFDERMGNVGDINLSLVAAMRFAGLQADPVILSTRANGLVVELYPVLSEFNYVVAKVTIGDKVYLADATERYYPFGMLPERCLNGKGRAIGEKSSYWVDLKPSETGKTISLLSLELDTDGVIRGTLVTTFMGYDAVTKRKEIVSFPSQDDYIADLKSELGHIVIKGYELKNVDDIDGAVTRELDIELTAFDQPEISNFLFNPFILDRWKENPFKSSERLYPVDFGVPFDRITVLNLAYPADFEILNVPEKVGLSLPNSGGRYLLESTNVGNKLSINNSLSIRRTIYSSVEYHYLKELFNRILQVQNGDLIFRKKT